MPAAALQLLAAFNLVCGGTERVGPIGLSMPEASGAPISVTFRIDLGNRLWCSDACDTIEAVSDAVEGVLVLRERHYPAGSSVIMIDPATGRFTDTRIDGDVATLRSGTCEPAPFTGFLNRIV